MAEDKQDKDYREFQKNQNHSQTIINDRLVEQIWAKADKANTKPAETGTRLEQDPKLNPK
ncbi:hypothetical protein P0082_05280 [Candidatus Haliotispira prima]|uniref:Uncharacterized protein n=1 Tax=Candidatus Haliotispira prima TaxID=3034016 RepID=A0ABY8MM56_9SPIO|nr:hypothetical protein P0082_05280 [Candidatus Haliotispira prima]